ncbi:hypothetical protein RIF29_03815 [Crotalaria pallida]|uniref:RING-type E3 ubiquitin transferase n=1 Tax=Crotalaria pallida TaxID=3830 RepID=A0AAN9J0C5_CROPI
MHHYHIIEWHLNNLNGSNFHSYNQGLYLLLCFIAIFILLPALFLCIYICRRLLSQHSIAAATTTSMVISELPAHQCIRVDYTNHHTVLPSSSSTTKSLISMVGAGFEKKEECCICLSHFQDNEKLKVLTECQHVYHSECLDMWLNAHPSCPLCRSSLHVSDPQEKSIISS